MSQLTFFAVEPPASHSASPASEKDWQTRVATSCSPSVPLLQSIGPAGWFGRTSPASCHQTADGTLAPSSGSWQNSGMGSPTAFLTLNTSEFNHTLAPSLRDDGVCSLSDILEDSGSVPQRYFFERASLCGHPAPRRQAGQGVAGTVGTSSSSGRSFGSTPIHDNLVAHALRAEGFDASEDGTGRGTPLIPAIVGQAMSSKWAKGTAGPAGPAGDEHNNLIPVPFDTTQITSAGNYSVPRAGDPCHPLSATAHAPCIAFPERMSGTQCASSEDVSPSLGALNTMAVATQWAVRRLTPLECERLQGFPDGHTATLHKGKPAADGPRYKALGNSWAVNCARWIGERIEAVDAIVTQTGPTKSQHPAPNKALPSPLLGTKKKTSAEHTRWRHASKATSGWPFLSPGAGHRRAVQRLMPNACSICSACWPICPCICRNKALLCSR